MRTRRGVDPVAEPAGAAIMDPKVEPTVVARTSDGRTPPVKPLTFNDPVVLAATATALHLDPGLYVLDVGGLDAPPSSIEGFEVPSLLITPASGLSSETMTILTAHPRESCWCDWQGETLVIKVPPTGGKVLLTVYAPAGRPCPMPEVTVRRLDHSGAGQHFQTPAHRPPVASRVVQTEAVLHIERLGDRQFVGEGWFGIRGRRLRVEAFSIRPLETLEEGDIEVMGYGPGGRQTPWVTGGKMCGTRNRALPLTGFAVRLAPRVCDRFNVFYEGDFFESGVAGPVQNGEPCLPTIEDDPLEAICVRIVER